MSNFAKKKLKIGIFGIGKSNLAIVDFLKRQNFDFSLTVRSDSYIKDFPSFPDATLYSGNDAYEYIEEDIIFISPSIRRDRPSLVNAKKRGVILSSDTDLFFEQNKKDIYAVTGSDGKSSTTYLISSILNTAGYNSSPAGNYGNPLCMFIDSEKFPVAELSSFQLMDTSYKTKRAVITNITQNHLDWHIDFSEYIDAKLCIAKNTEELIIDYDSRVLRDAIYGYPLFAAVSSSENYTDLKKHINAENYLTLKNDTVYLNGDIYFSLRGIKRTEPYNIKNFMLASATIKDNADRYSIESAVNNFGGLPHRKEIISIINGITYINSSIDSTPERTLQTLRSLKGDTAVIIGGKGKGLSLLNLAQELPKLTVGACLMGDIGLELGELLKNSEKYQTAYADSMSDAIKISSSFLKNGGTVILSPAGTSFDKYKNFENRGEDFINNCPKK